MGQFTKDPRPVVDCSVEPSLTKQSFKDECDINVIMAKYRKGALVTHLERRQPRWLDVSEITDFRQSVEYLQEVSEWFAGLPAPVREAFDNDPATVVEYMNDGNRDIGEVAQLLMEGQVPDVTPAEGADPAPVPSAPPEPPPAA